MQNLRLPVEEQRRLKDGEVWKSLPRGLDGSEAGGEDAEKAFKMAVVEQWGWLYCPEDLLKDLEGE